MSADEVEIELSFGGRRRRAAHCRVEEAASQVTRAVAEILVTDGDVDLRSAAGSTAKLRVTTGDGALRTFTLVVGAVDFLGARRSALHFAVSLHAHPWLLQHTLDTRKLRGMSAQEIIAKVLDEHGIAHAFRLTCPPRTRQYCAQYHESDLDFVRRLLEFEGIYFTFDEDGVMLLDDRSSACAPVDGPTSSFELIDATAALTKGEAGIHVLRRGAEVAPGQVTVNDFDWKKPRTSLLTTRSADADRELEVYDFPSGFREAEEGEGIAARRLEAHRAEAHYVEGVSSVVSFAPGRGFSFGALAGEMFAGEYFLTRVVHEARDATLDDTPGDASIYTNRFRAIPRSLPFRPRLRTPRPTVGGCHTAVVRGPAGEEIHTDQHGRFKAQFHWDREAQGNDQDSRWIRWMQESASSMTLARVGWEVSVGYIDGDPDRPVGFSRAINGAMPPAYAQPANMAMMTIKTPSSPATGGYSELKLDDTAGAQLFYTRAEKDQTASIKNDQTETVGHDETRTIDNDLSRQTGRDQSIQIGGDSTEDISGDRTLVVVNDRTKTVLGDETVKVDGKVTLSTQRDETEEVGSTRITITGGPKVPDLVADPKKAAQSLLPTAKTGEAALESAGGAAFDAASSAFDAGGGLSAVAGGAAQAAASSIAGSLQSLIPTPASIAGKLTGGLTGGLSFGGLADMLLSGSISRMATERTNRTVGGAFISASIAELVINAGKAHAETVGGLKLTATAANIAQAVTLLHAQTVGGASIRTSGAATVITSRANTVTVGALLGLTAAQKALFKSDTIAITGLTELDLTVGGAGIKLTSEAVAMRGTVEVETGTEIVFTGGEHNLVG